VRRLAPLLLVGCVSGGGDPVAAPIDAHVDVEHIETSLDEGGLFETEPIGCGGACTTAAPLCSGTSCSCPGTTCGGECVDVAGDPRNCGACGVACNADQYCRLMAGPPCKCRPPEVACSGACINRQSDPNNCGECGTSCPVACAKGACVDVCPSGTASCVVGGKTACIETAKDPRHCGSCGKQCAFDEVCAAGSCVRYRPAVGCATCPCSECATILPGSTCCAPLPGQPSSLCVAAATCP
jgi:hypothetical protein